MTDTLSEKEQEAQEIREDNRRALERAEKELRDIRETLVGSHDRLEHARRILRRAGYLHGAAS